MDNDTQLPPPIWVDTPKALRAMVDRLRGEPALAIDTESNSLYVYREQLCLVQISVPGVDFLVDGLAVTDLAPLGPLLADPAVCKVLHGAEYDLSMLHAHSRLAVVGLFDTMWASRILGWKEHGLAALIQAHFGVALNKKYQRADWGLRPLPAEQLYYARLDTHFLLPLSAIQSRALEETGRWPQAEHRFAELCLTRWEDHTFDPDGFWRLPGVHELDDAGRGVLRRLWALRDRCAQAENRPPFKILPNQILLVLSEVRPMTLPELRRVRGMPQRWVGRYGQALLDAIQQGEGEPVSWEERARPDHASGSQPRGRPTPACQERFAALRTWRNARAEASHVEPDIILSNHLLWAVAHRNPRQMADLGGDGLLAAWQVEEFGRDLLAVVRGANSGRAVPERRT